MVLQPTMQRITGFALISLVWVRCLLATSISGKEVGEALIMRKRDQFNRSLQESDSSARDDAFLTAGRLIPMEPLVWADNMTVDNAQDLRAALCRVIGADLEQVGKFQQCSSPLDNATAGGSVLIELTSDISLDGNPLPPVHGSVKIVGSCHVLRPRPCAIYAVDAACCDCASIWYSGSSDPCSDCRKGNVLSTQPLRVAAGGRLWLDSVEICSGRSKTRGGIIVLDPGNGQAWEMATWAGLTFLSAVDVTFTKGFTNDRGGAIASWRGSLAVLVRPRFQENYAAFGLSSNTNSHDAAVGKQSVLILEDPIPKEPSIYLEQKLTGTVSSIFDNGNVFRRVTHTPDLPNGSGASSDALTSGQVDGAATTKEDDAGRAANLNLPAILGGAGTACILLFVALWCNMRVPSREKPNPDFVYEDDANGYFIPNVDRAKEPRQSALTMQQMAEMDEQAERFKEGMEEAQRLERIAKRYNSSSNQTADDKGEEKKGQAETAGPILHGEWIPPWRKVSAWARPPTEPYERKEREQQRSPQLGSGLATFPSEGRQINALKSLAPPHPDHGYSRHSLFHSARTGGQESSAPGMMRESMTTADSAASLDTSSRSPFGTRHEHIQPPVRLLQPSPTTVHGGDVDLPAQQPQRSRGERRPVMGAGTASRATEAATATRPQGPATSAVPTRPHRVHHPDSITMVESFRLASDDESDTGELADDRREQGPLLRPRGMGGHGTVMMVVNLSDEEMD